MPFQCTIVTPEEQTFDAQVEQVVLPAHDGLMGILEGRAPILVRIGVGPLRLDTPGGQSQSYLIDGGIAQMKDNKLVVLTDDATPASQIDAEAARAAFAEAEARPATTPAEKKTRDHDLAKARAMLAMTTR